MVILLGRNMRWGATARQSYARRHLVGNKNGEINVSIYSHHNRKLLDYLLQPGMIIFLYIVHV